MFKGIITWFKSRPPAELDRVEGVVLGMSKPYTSAIRERFGESVQVINRFYVAKLTTLALDEVLRSMRKA